LINATRHGWASVVRLLVAKNGLDLDKSDNNGLSAVGYAANLNFTVIANLLNSYPYRSSKLRNRWAQATRVPGDWQEKGL
jgi:hypothetical protein